jgi:hypothetical protein
LIGEVTGTQVVVGYQGETQCYIDYCHVKIRGLSPNDSIEEQSRC